MAQRLGGHRAPGQQRDRGLEGGGHRGTQGPGAHGERGRGSRAPPAGGPPARGDHQRALWLQRGRSARAAAVSVSAVTLTPSHVTAGAEAAAGTW